MHNKNKNHQPPNQENPKGIADIRVVKYQQEYERIVGGIVFMNVPLSNMDQMHGIIDDNVFYATRGRDIATIVKAKTGNILTKESTLFIISDDKLSQNVACENIAFGIGIKEPQIIRTKYIREKISGGAKENSRHLLAVCRENLPKNLQALIVLVCTSKLATMSVALGYNNDSDTKTPEEEIKYWGEDKTAISYFPYKPTVLVK